MRSWRLLLAVFVGVLCVSALRAQSPKLVVLDTDIGDDIDDAFALSLLLRSPEVKLLGVSTAFGDTELRAHLAMRFLAAAGHPEIPVAAGVKTEPKTEFTQAAYAKGDTHALRAETGPEMILRLARAHPGQATLLAIGPLTNVRAAIAKDPEGFRMLARVVMMGGSIEHGYRSDQVPGNPPASEWNVRCDPEGLRALLGSGVPVTMLPLDATEIPLPAETEQAIAADPAPMMRALTELVNERAKPIVLYDGLTAACLVDASLCPTTPMRIAVDDAGFTKRVEGAANADVCLRSDGARFLALLRRRLTGK